MNAVAILNDRFLKRSKSLEILILLAGLHVESMGMGGQPAGQSVNESGAPP